MQRKIGTYLKMINHISVICFLLFCYFVVISPQSPEGIQGSTEDDRDGALVAVETEEDDQAAETDESARKVSVGVGEKQDPNVEVFYPTKEWQTVKPGQSIPKGLHVRMNFETKLVEAKLMDGDDGMKYWKQGDRQGMVNTKNKYFSHGELKEALKEFKANRDDVQDEKVKEEALKKKFRTYDELKKDFKKMKMDIKTDYEIITKLFEFYKNSSISNEERKSILSDFEYYLHQIDNAVDFANMGGLDMVVKDLNNTDPEIRSEAAFVIGAATQSNPKVQIRAMQAGAMQILIRMLSTEKDINLRSKVLYALSCLLRHFPYAQKKFLDLGGLATMTAIFSQPQTEKLQLKAISLTHDLLLEKVNVIQTANVEKSEEKEKLRQYNEVALREAMTEQGWCDLIPNLLDAQDHDTREKVLHAMEVILDSCKTNFIKSVGTLKQLKKEYEHLSHEEKLEGDDDYFQGLFNNLTNMISNLQSMHKDEL